MRLMTLILLTSCSTAVPEGRFACESASDCPDGWFCHPDLRCRSTSPIVLPDGSVVPDADFFPDGNVPPGTCDLVLQSGCIDGDKCTIVPWTTESLCQPAGTVPTFSSCVRTGADGAQDNCAAGSVCWQIIDGPLSCKAFCNTDADCERFGANSVCARMTVATTLTFCTWDCDPVANTGCVAGESCRITQFPERSDFSLDCLPDGPGRPGEPCLDHTDCSAGTGCVGLDGVHECRTLCGPTSSCPGGKSCAAIRDGVGYCIP